MPRRITAQNSHQLEPGFKSQPSGSNANTNDVISENYIGLWEGIGELPGKPLGSGTCIGACEGSCGNHFPLHRLFVVSPKLIVVLAQQFLRTPGASEWMNMHSSLVDIDHQQGGGPKESTEESLLLYGIDDAAQEDLFEFKIRRAR
jgi:hypothetical protein